MLAGFTHAPVVELSERLAALTGHALDRAADEDRLLPALGRLPLVEAAGRQKAAPPPPRLAAPARRR